MQIFFWDQGLASEESYGGWWINNYGLLTAKESQYFTHLADLLKKMNCRQICMACCMRLCQALTFPKAYSENNFPIIDIVRFELNSNHPAFKR